MTTSSSAERALRRNGGMGEILGRTPEAGTAADAAGADAIDNAAGGDAAGDAVAGDAVAGNQDPDGARIEEAVHKGMHSVVVVSAKE